MARRFELPSLRAARSAAAADALLHASHRHHPGDCRPGRHLRPSPGSVPPLAGRTGDVSVQFEGNSSRYSIVKLEWTCQKRWSFLGTSFTKWRCWLTRHVHGSSPKSFANVMKKDQLVCSHWREWKPIVKCCAFFFLILKPAGTWAAVTCGDWDLRFALPHQCQLSGLTVPEGMQRSWKLRVILILKILSTQHETGNWENPEIFLNGKLLKSDETQKKMLNSAKPSKPSETLSRRFLIEITILNPVKLH